MITLKYDDKVGENLGSQIIQQIDVDKKGDVLLQPVDGEEMSQGPRGHLGSIYDLLIDVILSKAVEVALEHLYDYLKLLIRERKNARLRVKVVGNSNTEYLQDFDLGQEEERSVDKLALHVKRMQQ